LPRPFLLGEGNVILANSIIELLVLSLHVAVDKQTFLGLLLPLFVSLAQIASTEVKSAIGQALMSIAGAQVSEFKAQVQAMQPAQQTILRETMKGALGGGRASSTQKSSGIGKIDFKSYRT
jgi:hypothetical protein